MNRRVLHRAVVEALESRRLLAADLTAAITSTVPAVLPLAGNVMTVHVTNVGDTPAVGTVVTSMKFINVNDLSFVTLTPAHTDRRINLAPGAGLDVILKFNVPSLVTPGTYTLAAEADHDNGVAEVDESNNFSPAVNVVVAAPFVDLS